jgi:hypothetical protein
MNGRMRSAALLAVAAAAFGAAGCGGSGGSSSATSSAAAAGGGKATNSTKAVQYAQCMRSHGVPSFPDPVNGRSTVIMKKGTDMDPDSPTFKAAQEACKAYAPSGAAGAGDPKQQAQMLKYVTCMRQNGVPNFPDPQDGRIVFKGGPKSGVDPNSPQFKAATQKCQKLLPAGGPGSGGQ